MLVSLMRGLESIPESSGTMMDNTLIEYTFNNAEKQYSEGADRPFVLLGNAGGRFKAGQHTCQGSPDQRPLHHAASWGWLAGGSL